MHFNGVISYVINNRCNSTNDTISLYKKGQFELLQVHVTMPLPLFKQLNISTLISLFFIIQGVSGMSGQTENLN